MKQEVSNSEENQIALKKKAYSDECKHLEKNA